MTSGITRAVLICCSLLALALVGVFSASSDNGDKRLGLRALNQSQEAHSKSKLRRSRSVVKPLTYRSPGRMHKVVIPNGSGEVEARLLSSSGTRRIREFQSYSLLEVSSETLAALDAATLEHAQLRDDLNLLLLRGGQIDTTGPNPQLSDELMHKSSSGKSLRLVQFSAPPTPDALRTLKTTGAKILSYVPNNAYLVWATTPQANRIQRLRDRSDVIQWESVLQPAFKLDPRINIASLEQTRVAIELADVPESAGATSVIESLSARVLMPEFHAAGGIHTRVLIEADKLPELAKLPAVVAIEPWTEIKLHDERANQIVANVLSEETINSIRVTRPSTPGFSVFLNSHGFNSSFDFAVDLGDSGFDRGAAIAGRSHPDFHDGTGSTRLAYMHDFSSDFAFHPDDATILPAHDTLGHGTLNASIVGGFNNDSGPAFRDSQGFQYGLGVAPMVRVGVTKLFNDNGSFAQGFSYTDIISAAYRGGARISTNSWGECNSATGRCNLYNLDCRAYDSFVRDADPDVPGNQGMVVIFSSGNEGQELPASINMPGAAKNVITVGASESFRATDSNGNPLVDGCGAGPTLADNVLDVPDFSSFGPVQDGRSKPDLVAPGSHMVGAATQDPGFTAKPFEDIGVCDYFFPTGQTQYTWSTGTSHAAPVVAGGAALAFQWLRNRFGTDPSPAMIKALLLNSTSYLTAKNGNDDLPGNHQGWGLLNLARAFESVDRILHDESPVRTFTQSGGTPFEITGTVTDPSREFRVMLVWTDAPGSSTSNAPYVNQLNLEVSVGGVLYQGNHFSGQYSTPGGEVDFLNNAQAVRLPAGVTGPFVIRVKPSVIAGDGVPGNGIDLDQDFALVVTNGREAAVPVLAVNEADGLSVGAT
ncbi:MAG TPA: S8 family serine peptidase, partial [Blastocatellia bacterium]|nr:S8 family serine peptidase [Blastocatellia bacterium]